MTQKLLPEMPILEIEKCVFPSNISLTKYISPYQPSLFLLYPLTILLHDYHDAA